MGPATITRRHALIPFLGLLLCQASTAQQAPAYDYGRFNRDLVQRGMQALMMCNGLFTSGRTLEQLFGAELKFLKTPIGTTKGGEYQVDWARRAVSVGAQGYVPTMRSVFREGIGCVAMAPDQAFDDIDRLPFLKLPPPAGDAATIPWPSGDLTLAGPLPSAIDAQTLASASDWAFERESPEQVTLSLLVIYKGQIVHERYAPGVNMNTRTRTWSVAKSIAATLVGMLVDAGQLSLDEPLRLDWLPRAPVPESDPRSSVTLRSVLNMSSGLDPVDRDSVHATGSDLAYWAGVSSAQGALRRTLFRKPGTYWSYQNYDTLLAVLAMKQVLGSEEQYHEFPRRALLDRIGMRNTLLGTDRFGDFVLSSQVYTNARDLGRFGLLYLQQGVWLGERLLSERWINFARTPAPATAHVGQLYGAQWWLVPRDRMDVPRDAYAALGSRGQCVIIVPSRDLVIVRRGLDYGRQGFDPWALTREVLKAFAAEAKGE